MLKYILTALLLSGCVESGDSSNITVFYVGEKVMHSPTREVVRVVGDYKLIMQPHQKSKEYIVTFIEDATTINAKWYELQKIK